MSRERLVEMTRINIDHHVRGATGRTDAITAIPASNYFDRGRWQQEVDLIFKRLPLALALSAELRQPATYKAMEVLDTPVLLCRDENRRVRAFINMCSHRGTMLVEEGGGQARRFTCPYHGWSYDCAGKLVGIFRERDFGEIDRETLGLVELPCAERAGIVWVNLSPDPAVDVDTFLGGYDKVLDFLGLADMVHHGRRVLPGPNWKVAFDGYVDFYHLPQLHRNTFGENTSPDAVFHPFGPHQRIASPSDKADKLAKLPEEQWAVRDMIGGVWSIFPHASVAGFRVGGTLVYQVARLFPGADPESSITHLDFVSLEQPDDPDFASLVDKQIDFLLSVVRDEDYHTGLKIQRSLRSGARKELLFGRNEGGAQHVHGWLDRVLECTDEDLPALFNGR
ncbi:MAG: aromatic ring-hydroxylating oxygenase subunit alpha [Acidimicrobiales bacterium]